MATGTGAASRGKPSTGLAATVECVANLCRISLVVIRESGLGSRQSRTISSNGAGRLPFWALLVIGAERDPGT